jgi:hypothetical protein
MAVVEQFSRAMIEKYLRAVGMRFLRDEDGDFLVQFGYSEPQGCELSLYFIAGGQKNEIYTLRAFSDRRFTRDQWSKVVTLCNTWNSERRWPKAYMDVKNSDADAFGVILLEEQIDLEKGIHQELLDDFSNTFVVTVGSFWKWAHQEQGL